MDQAKRQNYTIVVTEAQRDLLVQVVRDRVCPDPRVNRNLSRALLRNVRGAQLTQDQVPGDTE